MYKSKHTRSWGWWGGLFALFLSTLMLVHCEQTTPSQEDTSEQTQLTETGNTTEPGGSSDTGADAGTTPEPGGSDLVPGDQVPDTAQVDLDPKVLLKPQVPTDHTFTTTLFTGSEECAFCHNGISDQQGQDVSIEKHWSSTMMANSARDPLWRAKLQSEVLRHPKLKAVIEDKCTKCHAPMANTQQKHEGTPISALGAGFLDSQNKLYHAAMEGVSCTLCHQIKPDPALGTPALTSGNYSIGNTRTIYGPYTNPFSNPMKMHVNYTPTYSQHISSSALCASCHDLKTPFVDQKGEIVPKTKQEEFPEQMVYSEWLHSDYRDDGKSPKSCQSCHMAQTKGVAISTRPRNLSPRGTFSKHIFVGGNAFMLRLMQANRTALGIKANQFALTIDASEKMLRSSAAVAILNPTYQAETLKFQVKVTNKSGHKLPSGYPSRRVILHVVVSDSAGKVVFESGKIGAGGEIVGLKSERDLTTWTPHYDEITSSSQVQIYEPVMKSVEGTLTHTLLRAASYAKDNRLLPVGFKKESAPSDIQVHGKAKTDPNFVGGEDLVTYRISGITGDKLSIKVELLYQSVSYPFVQDLFRHQDVFEVLRFRYMWQQAPSYTDLIATSTQNLP